MAMYPQQVALEELEFFKAQRRGDERYVLVIRGKGVVLSSRACRLVKELLTHKGCVLRREYLIEALAISGEKKGQTLNEYVRQLKLALREHQVQATITTADMVGYALCPFA